MKLNISGPDWPFTASIQRFTKESEEDFAHSHDGDYRVIVLYGGFVEEIYHPTDSGCYRTQPVTRLPGDSWLVTAGTVHRITDLLGPEAWVSSVSIGEPYAEVRKWRCVDGQMQELTE